MSYLTVLALFTLIAPALADEPAPANEPNPAVQPDAQPVAAPLINDEAGQPAKDLAVAAAFDAKYRALGAKLAAVQKDLVRAMGRNEILEAELNTAHDRSKQLSDDRLNDRQALARTSAQKDSAVADAQHVADLNERLMKKLDASSSNANSLGVLITLVALLVFLVGIIGIIVWRRTSKVLARLPDDETELMLRRLRENFGRVSEELQSAKLRRSSEMAEAEQLCADLQRQLDEMALSAVAREARINELSSEIGTLRSENGTLLAENVSLRLLKTPPAVEQPLAPPSTGSPIHDIETPGPDALAQRHDQAPEGSRAGSDPPGSHYVEIDLGPTPPPVLIPPSESVPVPIDPDADATRRIPVPQPAELPSAPHGPFEDREIERALQPLTPPPPEGASEANRLPAVSMQPVDDFLPPPAQKR
jgi:hypothetical protein